MKSQKLSLFKKSSAGFTIIELLVVISIIALLAAIIIAALSKARDQGSQGAGLAFADHNYQAFGADALVTYNFNSLTGGNIADISGNNRTLTPNAGSFTLSTKTPNLTGMSYTSNSSAGGVYGSATLPSPVTFTNYTLSAWVYFNSLSCPSGSCLIASAEISSGNYAMELTMDSTGAPNCYSDALNTTTQLTPLQTGKWYHIACTLNASTSAMVGFINGKQINSTTGSYNANNAKFDRIYVGGENGTNINVGISGYIDDVSLYSHSIVTGI